MAEQPLIVGGEGAAVAVLPRYINPLTILKDISRSTWKFARSKPLGAAGALVLLLMVVMALGAEWIAPYDPLYDIDSTSYLSGPTLDHPFGTDQLGRDLFSRIVHGARPSLYTGLLVVSIAGLLGMLLGVTSAYLRGTFDLLAQRVVDAFTALPPVLFAIAILTMFSSGIHIWIIDIPVVKWSTPLTVVVTLIILFIPSSSRIVRGATFAIINSQYVDAARVVGGSHARIILRHLVPNVVPVVIVIASVQLGNVILIESSLSFLGLGLPPPHPSWGGMLQGSGRQYMEAQPGLAIFPGIAISLAVLAFNLFGDALRDVLDPRLRGAGGLGLTARR